jgi:hypothetical protein
MAIRGSFVLFGNIIPERQLKVKRKFCREGTIPKYFGKELYIILIFNFVASGLRGEKRHKSTIPSRNLFGIGTKALRTIYYHKFQLCGFGSSWRKKAQEHKAKVD